MDLTHQLNVKAFHTGYEYICVKKSDKDDKTYSLSGKC